MSALTLSTLIAERAEQHPDRRLYTFLDDAGEERGTLTFGELEAHTREIAARLTARVAPGERALIVAADNRNFILAFAACQRAGVIAVPVYPPLTLDQGSRLESLRAIVRDSAPAAAIGDLPIGAVDRIWAAVPELTGVRWTAVEADGSAPAEPQATGVAPAVAPDDVAFLQYTSGSTSLPKGVVVTHEALLRQEEMLKQTMRFTATEVGAGWLPLFHDMGLIGYVLQPLYIGGSVVLMPPLAFLQRPARWLEAITRYGAAFAGAPNFAYELCVSRVTAEEVERLDLGGWRLAFNGAEPIRPATLDAFARTFRPCGFDERAWFPCYGLAESTLLATAAEFGAGAVRATVDGERLAAGELVEGHDVELVSSGTARIDRRVEIVDPRSAIRVEPGQIGEIWLAGEDVADGYWRRPEDTEAVFGARIADSGDGPFLRTGDLGAIHDGELFVTGRLKDIIIVAGRNHYPHDIELTAEAVGGQLRRGCSAAVAIEEGGSVRVALVAEVRTTEDLPKGESDGLARAIRAAIAERHGIQVHDVAFLAPRTIPKTSSGKLQRHACRTALQRGELALVGRSVLARPPKAERC